MQILRSFFLIMLLAGMVAAAGSRTPIPASSSVEAEAPEYDEANHNLGRLSLGVSNSGYFGGAEYPRRSYKSYLSYGNLVIGAIRDGDTLAAQSFNPSVAPNGRILERSSMDPSRSWYDSTAAHQDCLAIYYDTCTACPRGYRSLNIEVTERSRSWAFDYAQELVIFDYAVKNLGTTRLNRMYVGLYCDGDVASTAPNMDPNGALDDMVGLLERFPATYLSDGCPPDTDVLNIAWTADDDANLTRPQEEVHLPDISGVAFIRAPRDRSDVTFNWWSRRFQDPYRDFGPQARASYRALSGGWGQPRTREEWYHFLSNGERDYDQAFQSSITEFDAVWVPPPDELKDSVLTKLDPRYLLSIGPFGLDPGQSLHFTTAFVVGPAFHRTYGDSRFLPYNPYSWYQHVFFDRLALNTMWANWIYDNPGIDTDSDGYAGEYLLCQTDDSSWECRPAIDTTANPDTTYDSCGWAYAQADTVWRSGDGVPDFRGAFPPPNPSIYFYINNNGDSIPALRVFPEVGKIRLVWNGAATEATIDQFSRQYDFEGYAVYLAHDSRPSSYGLVTTYDKENWFRWQYDYARRTFVCAAAPYTLEQLRCFFAHDCADTIWRPEPYTRSNPLEIPAGPKVNPSIYFFEPCGYNRSIMANDPVNANSAIRKVYPDAPRPPFLALDSLDYFFPDRSDTTYFTPDGFLKYYEYEYVFDGLLPTVSYYVNVTAFDHGYPGLGLIGLEGDPSSMPRAVYPLPSSEVIEAQGLEVFVYPNPYRIDENYRDLGYEGIGKWHVSDPDKTRLVHFANLPRKCTIKIYTLDGDLVRQLEHDVDKYSYLANHATWDLINKNFQLVVSGLYYWVVEDDEGNTQIGKLVVIM